VIAPNQPETRLVTTVVRKVTLLVIAPTHEKVEFWKQMLMTSDEDENAPKIYIIYTMSWLELTTIRTKR
jgi:hypothetical protein